MNSPVFKSLLYVPADKPRMMEKARALACHAIIFDLEDAVGPDQKIAARENLVNYLQKQISIPYFVRINPVGTDYFEADILALIKIKPLGIILPKATERTVIAASAALDNLGEPAASFQIIPLMESALAIETVLPTISASFRVTAAHFGAEDLTADLGIQRTTSGEEISYARHRLVYGCRAKGLPAWDTPFLDFQNPDCLLQDCTIAKRIGFDGKVCIHPSQISVINQAFTPTQSEIAEAREILEAARDANGGAFSLNGKMIDGPVVDRAKRILASSD